MRKRFTLRRLGFLVSPLSGLFILFMSTGVAFAAYNPSYLISDQLFTDYTSMSTTSIQSFLVSKNSGLKDVTDTEACDPIVQPYSYTYFPNCTQTVSAATIIYDAAQAYQISPKAIIATLQKEQSLITTPNPTQAQINCAMGYNSCSGFVGFFKQVDNGTWQLREYIETMNSRNWWGKTSSNYPCRDAVAPNAYYSTGLYPGRTVTFYNQGGSARTVTLANSATAGLYCYTPYVGPYSETGYSGSYNFVTSFEQWFGSVASPCYNDSNVVGVGYAAKILANQLGTRQIDNLTLTFLNNTSSACIEAHTWNLSGQSWYSNVATNHPALDPGNDELISGDVNGDGKDEIMLVKMRGGASGMIEVHTWDPTYQHWVSNIATNHPAVDPINNEVIAADVTGDGKDELVLIKLQGGASGMIEAHTWTPGEQSWYSNVATNLPAVNPADNRVIAANTLTDGGRIDKLILVKYRNSVSGKIEIHTWNPGEQSWYSNVATNHPAVDPANNEVIAADTNGDGKDELLLIKYRGGESGKIEVHDWGPNEQTWLSNIATNHPAVDPALSYTL